MPEILCPISGLQYFFFNFFPWKSRGCRFKSCLVINQKTRLLDGTDAESVEEYKRRTVEWNRCSGFDSSNCGLGKLMKSKYIYYKDNCNTITKLIK